MSAPTFTNMHHVENDSISSSSESDEEERAKLRSAAVDISFITPKETEKKDVEVSSGPSRSEAPDVFKDNFLDVTPEFQQHIAKKLRRSLDATISLTTVWSPVVEPGDTSNDFRLFKQSQPGSDFTSKDDYVQRRPRISSISSDEEMKVSQSAVSLDEILQQRDLLFPNKLTRGTVEEIPAVKKKKKKKKAADKSVNQEKAECEDRKTPKHKKTKHKDNANTNGLKDNANTIGLKDIANGELTKSQKKRLRLKKLQETKDEI